jgi:hypothetical protein
VNVSTLWKSRRNKRLALVTAWLLALPSLAHSEARQFMTMQPQGEIWIMPPLGSEWRRLKDDHFDEGSLLRLMPGASVELKQTGRDLSAAEVEARLRIAEPLIVRVDRNIFKQLRYKDYVLDGLWGEGVSQEKAATTQPLLNFMAAYVRHLLSIETAQELPRLKADPQKESLESAQKISNLPLLSPNQDSLHFLSDQSADIPLYWESPDDSLRFKIFLWPAGDMKREALATVQGHRYLLTVRKPGVYRLQISSVDYRYRSEVLRLTIDRPLGFVPNGDPLEKQFTSSGLTVTQALQFQYPPPALDIQTNTHKADVLFIWSDRDGLQAGDQYKLMVQSAKDGNVLKVTTQETFARLRLEPGTWHYFVMKQSRVKRSKPMTSSSQQLQVLDKAIGSSSWRKLGRKAHDIVRDETVLLDLRY